MVMFSAANDSSRVARYRVTGKGKYCQVIARTAKYTCSLTGLAAGELVPVEVVACSADGVCSDPATGAGFTTPEGIHLSLSAPCQHHLVFTCGNISILDPESVSISNLTQTSFQLTVDGPAGNPDIDHFEVEAVGGGESHSCNILHKDEPWRCSLEGLAAGTTYTTTTKSCMPWQGGCSAGLRKVVETPAA